MWPGEALSPVSAYRRPQYCSMQPTFGRRARAIISRGRARAPITPVVRHQLVRVTSRRRHLNDVTPRRLQSAPPMNHLCADATGMGPTQHGWSTGFAIRDNVINLGLVVPALLSECAALGLPLTAARLEWWTDAFERQGKIHK